MNLTEEEILTPVERTLPSWGGYLAMTFQSPTHDMRTGTPLRSTQVQLFLPTYLERWPDRANLQHQMSLQDRGMVDVFDA